MPHFPRARRDCVGPQPCAGAHVKTVGSLEVPGDEKSRDKSNRSEKDHFDYIPLALEFQMLSRPFFVEAEVFLNFDRVTGTGGIPAVG